MRLREVNAAWVLAAAVLATADAVRANVRRVVLVTLLLATGCVSNEVRHAVAEWREGWELHKRITVAAPGVEPAAVASHEAALDLHLETTEALVR